MKKLGNSKLEEWAKSFKGRNTLNEIFKKEKKMIEKRKEMRLKDIEKQQRFIVK